MRMIDTGRKSDSPSSKDDWAAFDAMTGEEVTIAALSDLDYWVIDAATLETRDFRDPPSDGYVTTFDAAADATLTPLLLPSLALTLRSLDVG